MCAVSLHDLKRTSDAYELLLPALKKPPVFWAVPYNLACYAGQLGDHARARELLELAYSRGSANGIKETALADPDLAPLWVEGRR